MKLRRLLITSILVVAMILTFKIIKNYNNTKNIKLNKEKTVISINKKYDNLVEKKESKKNIIQVKKVEYNVVGKIVINKIRLDYPILEGATEDNLKISITRFYGSQINTLGNCILAGHDMKDGSLFGKLWAVTKGDSIILYDNSGNKKEYKVFNIKVIAPTDLSILSQDTDNSCWITLLTCSNYGKSRLIIRAKEM